MAQGEADQGILERLNKLSRAFLPATPVAEAELLAGRTEQLFTLVEIVDVPGAHAAIYGERA